MQGQDVEGLVQNVLSRADEAEAMYRTLVDLVPAITYVEALDTRRTFSVSPQIESILGFTPEEWLGESARWEGALHPDDRDRVVASCVRANETFEPWREEYRMVAKDGPGRLDPRPGGPRSRCQRHAALLARHHGRRHSAATAARLSGRISQSSSS